MNQGRCPSFPQKEAEFGIKSIGISDFFHGFSGFDLIRDFLVHFLKSFRKVRDILSFFPFQSPKFNDVVQKILFPPQCLKKASSNASILVMDPGARPLNHFLASPNRIWMKILIQTSSFSIFWLST